MLASYQSDEPWHIGGQNTEANKFHGLCGVTLNPNERPMYWQPLHEAEATVKAGVKICPECLAKFKRLVVEMEKGK